MTGNQKLQILQYNVQKSRDVVLASLFRNPKVTEYDILAIQEPWRNPFIHTTYHPLKSHFHLTYLDDPSTRVCFYINKRIDNSTWNVTYVSKDIIFLTIVDTESSRNKYIFNVYNEPGTNTLLTLSTTMKDLEPDSELVLLGDFNLHHPLWSGTYRRAGQGPTPQQLLTIIEENQLHLLTVPGTPTHRWKGGQTTIDLTFAT